MHSTTDHRYARISMWLPLAVFVIQKPVRNGLLDERHMGDESYSTVLADEVLKGLQHPLKGAGIAFGIEAPEPLVDEDCVEADIAACAFDHVAEGRAR